MTPWAPTTPPCGTVLTVRARVIALAAHGARCCDPASAAENTTAAKAAAISAASETFIVGNVTFALLHEFGHAIIRDFDVPLLGLEEESADTIAAVALIRLDAQHPERDSAKCWA